MWNIRNLICLCSLVSIVCGTGEINFLHSPKSVVFQGHESLDQSLIKEVLASSFGFTTTKNSDWSGLDLKDPFNLAEAAVVIVIDGVKSLGNLKGHSFPVISDEDESVGWLVLREKVETRFPGFNNSLLRYSLADVTSVTADPGYGKLNSNEISISYLDESNAEDLEFLRQLMLLNSISEQALGKSDEGKDGLPDLYWIVFSGLHPVVDLHGEDSPAAEEAKQLLRDEIIHLKKNFIHAYNGQLIIATLTSDVSHTRRARDVRAGEDEKPKNLSKDYSENYPVIFNIILWFMIAFVFSLIAISIAISTMDPGRDSIIYRMTSNRMKKDN